MATSEEIICRQGQKEVKEEYFDGNSTLSDGIQQTKEIKRAPCNVVL